MNKLSNLGGVRGLKLTKVASAVLLGLACSNIHAGAFSLFGEANGRNAGDFGAGAAVEAADASTLFYNPAGLMYLNGQQVTLGGTLVHAKAKFAAGSTISQPGTTLSVAGESANSTAVIPFGFYAKRVTPKLAVGVGMYVPYGLATDWGDSTNDPLRISATRSTIQVINVSPAIATSFGNKVKFGMAFDVQFGKVDLNSVPGALAAPTLDTKVINQGTSVGFGGHAGLMFDINEQTRFGANYQSRVQHQFSGDSTAAGPLTGGATVTSNLFSDPVDMPDSVTFSGMRQINEKLTVMGTAAWFKWSNIQQITINNLATGGSTTLPENFKNTWRLVAGAKYQVNDKFLVRAGAGFDQTPVNNVDRNIRLPDNDRIALAIGGHYQVSKTIGLDAGYTHLFVKDAPLAHRAGAPTNVTVNGVVNAAVDLLGAQLTWQIS